MDWFERITGFAETTCQETRRRLRVADGKLHSATTGRARAMGDLELVSLQTLRDRVASGHGPPGAPSVRTITGNVRHLHARPEFAGALFQVASQFNLLEMSEPGITPEHGVTRYQDDHTQGPACAMAAGAATIYRNYLVPVNGKPGQTHDRQLNGLAAIGAALAEALDQPVKFFWNMKNGYAFCTAAGLARIADHLASLDPAATDRLRGLLHIGLHQDVEVTDLDTDPPRHVSQAFCSALPVAYSNIPPPAWRPFAQLVLDAAYEATLLAALLNARRGASNTVLLTRVGGGAFGNDAGWIDTAIRRAVGKVGGAALDVRMVGQGSVLDPLGP